MKWHFLQLLFFLLASGQVSAKDYSYIRFTTSNGLAGNNVYGFVQDKDGFLWIGTETGLSRFDGYNFKNFTTKQGLARNDIVDLFVDHKNRVWIFPFCDAPCFYEKGQLYNRSNNKILGAVPVDPRFKMGIAEDIKGNLLIGSGSSCIFIQPDNKILTVHLPTSKNFSFRPEKATGLIPMEMIAPEFRSALPNTLYYENRFQAGNAWIINNNSREVYIYEDGNYEELIKMDVNDYLNACYSSDTDLLINTSSGCYFYSLRTRSVYDTLLTGMSVNISFRDEEGGIWVGTYGSGAYYFPATRCIGVKAVANHEPRQIHYFSSYGDKVWAGSHNYQFWPVDMKNKHIGQRVSTSDVTPEMLYQSAGVIQKDAYRGIIRILQDRHKIRFPISVNGIKSVMNVQDTLIMADLIGDIYKFTFPDHVLDKVNIGKRATCALYESGSYYIGALDSLYVIDRNHSQKALLKGAINTLAYSRKNRLLWVGTLDNGVYCLKNNRVIGHFNDKSGLSNNICKCAFTDGTKVYIGTIDGLNIIDPDNGFHIEHYFKADGLLANEINNIQVLGNTVAAGTSEGISFLDVSSPPPLSICKLALTEVIVSEQHKAIDSNDIILKPYDNNIKFTYSGISFRSMGRMKYKYRLNGLDNRWQETSQGYLSYPSLPPGYYEFEIYAINRFNVHSNVARFSFTVRQRWWQYWWVQTLFISAAVGAIAAIIGIGKRRQRKKEKEQLRLKEKIVELEQLALRSQMNPHFIFNSLNSFYQYVIRKDLKGASEYMSNFSRLIRLLFETTTLTQTSLEKEIDFLTTYLKLEQTKHNNKFSFKFNIQQELIIEETIVPTFIIQPFIENSIRHGVLTRSDNLGHILIDVLTENGTLKIVIDDNGVGRKGAEERKGQVIIHRSRGLSLTKERIDLYNRIHGTHISFDIKDKYDDEGNPAGTKVTIHFP